MLGEFSIESIQDAERARTALTRLADTRRDYLEGWQVRSNDCRRRIAVNKCQNELKAERQAFESKVGEIEIRARQVIRNDTLTERNSNEARSGGRPFTPSERSGSSSDAEIRSRRLQENEAKLAEHAASLERRKQLGIVEAAKRRDRMLALEQRRQEQRRKIEAGRKLGAGKRAELEARQTKSKTPKVPAAQSGKAVPVQPVPTPSAPAQLAPKP